MNWVDLLMLLVVATSVGFWSYGIVAAYLLDYVSSKAIANLIGFFVIFAAVLFIGAIIGRILAKFLKWAGLSWLDRLLGGAFGLVRGAVIAAAMVTVLVAFAHSPPPRSVVDSKLMPYVIDVSGVLAAMTPREIKDAFYDTRDRVKKMWSEQASHKPEGLRRE